MLLLLKYFSSSIFDQQLTLLFPLLLLSSRFEAAAARPLSRRTSSAAVLHRAQPRPEQHCWFAWSFQQAHCGAASCQMAQMLTRRRPWLDHRALHSWTARGAARKLASGGSVSSVKAMLRGRAYLRSMAVITCSYIAGDVVCQHIEAAEWRNQRRTAEFAMVGGLLMAPMSHTLEAGLEHVFPGSKLRPILQKIIARIFVAPIFLSVSFGSLALLRNEDVSGALRAKVWPAWKTGSLFWPAVAAITYRFVPLAARPATGAMVGSVWSCYLSWIAFTSRSVSV